LIDYNIDNGYAIISRTWKKGDQVEVVLPMEVRRVAANEKLTDNIGKIALQRGPIMYCAEWVDNFGKTNNIILPPGTTITNEFKTDMLHGVMLLKADVPAVIIDHNSIHTVVQKFTAIPYYSWANRGKGEMMVWFPTQVKDIELLTK